MALTTVIAHIASGASLSAAVQVPGTIVAIEVPGDWTDAPLSFQGSPDGAVYNDVYDEQNNEAGKFVVAGALNAFRPNDITGSVWMKFRSGLSGSPIPQSSFSGIDLVLTVAI